MFRCFSGAPDVRRLVVPIKSVIKSKNGAGYEAPAGKDTVPLDMLENDTRDSLINLQRSWQGAEFNVFGDCCVTESNFNSGTTIIVRVDINDGTTKAPSCSAMGFTGETNNLTLISPCCPIGGSSPGIVFTESNAAGTKSICACPTGAAWNPDLAACVCSTPGQDLVDGQCKTQTNACGGTTVLAGVVGRSCGLKCGHFSCSGPNSLRCESFANACGGCSAFPRAPGEGPQPGESCDCGNDVKGHHICAGTTLSCDCHQL